MNKNKVVIGALGLLALSGCSGGPQFAEALDCDPDVNIVESQEYVHHVQVGYKGDKIWSTTIVSRLNEQSYLSTKTIQTYVSGLTNGEPDTSEVEYGVDARIGIERNAVGELVGFVALNNAELTSWQSLDSGIELPQIRTLGVANTFTKSEVEFDISAGKDESVLMKVKTCPLTFED